MYPNHVGEEHFNVHTLPLKEKYEAHLVSCLILISGVQYEDGASS